MCCQFRAVGLNEGIFPNLWQWISEAEIVEKSEIDRALWLLWNQGNHPSQKYIIIREKIKSSLLEMFCTLSCVLQSVDLCVSVNAAFSKEKMLSLCDATDLNPEILAWLYLVPAQQEDFLVHFFDSWVSVIADRVEGTGGIWEFQSENTGLKISCMMPCKTTWKCLLFSWDDCVYGN